MAGTRTVAEGVVDAVRPVARLVMPGDAELARLDETEHAVLRRLHDDPTDAVSFVDHELFHKPTAEKIVFGRKQSLSPGSTRFDGPDPLDLVSNNGDSCTLTTAHEIQIFQQYNYARMRVAQLIAQSVNRQMPGPMLCELLAWMHRAMDAREVIAAVNMPLVLAMAKRTRLSCLDYNELVSEGNFALLRSVDKFDCARGFKFSTYACRAILKSFSRVAMKASRYRGQFPTEFDPFLEKSDFADRKRDNVEADCVEEIRDILASNKAALNDMERTVIRERFALESGDAAVKPKTLEQVGEMIGVTKERVRQIQNKALRKIRLVLEDSLAA